MAIAEFVDSGSAVQRSDIELGYDRRRSPRTPVCERALIAVQSEDSYQKLLGVEVLDISGEGFGLFASEHVDIGRTCTIFGDDTSPRRIEGVVTRCSPCQDGFIVGVTCCQRMAA